MVTVIRILGSREAERVPNTIRRSSQVAIIDSWPINSWSLTVTKSNGEVVDLAVDCIDVKVYEAGAKEASFQNMDEVYRAYVDAAYEREEKDRRLPFFLGPDNVPITNPRYDG